MNHSGTTRKQFIIYMAVTFGLSWILQIIASKYAQGGNRPVFTTLLSAAMFTPLLGTLAAGIPLKGMGFIPRFKDRAIYIFFSLWMPALLSVLGGLLFFVLFPAAFDAEFRTLQGALDSADAIQTLENQGISIPMYLTISIIQALTIAPFINMIPSLGEEVGWRGALYPFLKEQLGVTRGRIAGGTIWGIWHWPVIILAGYEYGTDYIGSPILGPLVFCLFRIAGGILLDFVYEKSETIWLPALMHGAVNAFSIFAYLLKPEYANLSILGPSYIGLISMIPVVILAAVVCRKQSISEML